MPLLNPIEESRVLRQNGYDPDTHTIGDDGNVYLKGWQQAPAEASASPNAPSLAGGGSAADDALLKASGPRAAQTPLETAARSAGTAAIPTAVGLGGGALATAAGTLLAPETGGLSLLIPLIAGIAGGIGSAKAADKYINPRVLTDNFIKKQAEGAAQNPKSALAGSLIPQAATMQISPRNLGAAGKTLAQLLRPAGNVALDTRAIGNLLNVGAGTGLGAYQGYANQRQQNPDASISDILTSPEFLLSTAAGAAMNEPRGYMKYVGMHPTELPTDWNKLLLEAAKAKSEPIAKNPPNPADTLNAALREVLAGRAEVQPGELPPTKQRINTEILPPDIAPEAKVGKGVKARDVVQSKRDAETSARHILQMLEGGEQSIPREQAWEQSSLSKAEPANPNSGPAMESDRHVIQSDWQKQVGDEVLPEDRTITQKFWNTWQKFAQQHLNIDVQAGDIRNDEGTPIAGQTTERDAAGKVTNQINPDEANIGTLPHEATHNKILDLLNSPDKGQRAFGHQFLEQVSQTPEYQKWQASREAQGATSDVQEYTARLAEIEATRYLKANKGAFKEYFNDVVSGVKKLGGVAKPSDYARILRNKLINDRPYSQEFPTAIKPGGTLIPAQAKQSDEPALHELVQTAMQKQKDGMALTQDERVALEKSKEANATMAEDFARQLGVKKTVQSDQPEDLGTTNEGDNEFVEPTADVETTESPVVRIANAGGRRPELNSDTPELSTDKRAFVTQAEKILDEENPRSLLPASQLLNKVRNKLGDTSHEWDMLKKAGIEGAFSEGQRITPTDMQGWIAKNGPQTEVHAYGMEGKVSDVRKAYDLMKHEWYDNLDSDQKRDFSTYMATKDESYLERLNKQKADEFADLSFKANGEQFDSTLRGPRATSAYSHVSPLPTNEPMPDWTTSKEGKNVQRVDVVLPQTLTKNAREEVGFSTAEGRKQIPLWQPDNLHENLPNTIGWAMIQYKTGANGEKIALIGEAQSRWGQALRDLKHSEDFDSARDHSLNYQAKLRQLDHPLLRDYNRLILKAAIEQARKEGATHIVVSDAETSMMSEGHDLHQRYQVEDSEGNVLMQPTSHEQASGYYKDWKKYNPEGRAKIRPVVEQEKGMRLNYDSILPKIAEELTGQKGEKVSLGEHKNAFERENHRNVGQTGEPGQPPDSIQIAYDHSKTPRSNLIFRNPDGTPKTDVSGLMYDISRPAARLATGERMTMTGKRYSDKPEITGPDSVDQPQRRSLYDVPGVIKIASETEKIKRLGEKGSDLRKNGQIVGNALAQHLENERALRGELEHTPARDIQRLSRPSSVGEFARNNTADMDAVVKYLDAKFDGRPVESELTPTQEAIKERFLQAGSDAYEKMQSVPSLRHEGSKPAENYPMPVMSLKAIEALANNPSGSDAQGYHNDFLKYRTEIKGQSETEAQGDWNALRSSMTQQNRPSAVEHFGPIDKVAGLGLPESMREPLLLNRLARYTGRYAKRIAYEQAVKSKPEVMDALDNPAHGIASNQYVARLLKDIRGQSDMEDAKVAALGGLARSGMFGTLTGIKDVATAPFQGMQHQDVGQVIPAAWEGMSKLGENVEKAYKQGVLRGNLTALENGEGGMNTVLQHLQNWNRIANVAQGRQLLETVARSFTFGQGKWLAADALASAKSSRLTAQKRAFLDEFIPEWRKHVESDSIDDSVLDPAAAKWVEANQGSYDARGLPRFMTHGATGTTLSVMRWNAEKMNNFIKYSVDPMLNGNPKPFLMQTIGAIAGGALVEKLVEEITGRKSKAAGVDEIADAYKHDKNYKELLAYKMATLSDLAGYGGVLGNLARTAGDIKEKNQVQSITAPAQGFIQNVGKDVSDFVTTADKSNPEDYLKLVNQMLYDYSQTYRIIHNKVDDEASRRLETSNKMRDKKVWSISEGKDLPDAPNSVNVFDRPAAKKFKQSDDMSQATGLVHNAIAEAFDASRKDDGTIDITKLKSKMDGLKHNSYQTMPNIEKDAADFMNFYQFLERTQGKEEATKRMQDFLHRNAVNQAKSEMVPSL